MMDENPLEILEIEYESLMEMLRKAYNAGVDSFDSEYFVPSGGREEELSIIFRQYYTTLSGQ